MYIVLPHYVPSSQLIFLGLVAPILTRKAAAPIDPEVPQLREHFAADSPWKSGFNDLINKNYIINRQTW